MDDSSASPFHSMSREELLRALEMFAKNWLAHDGCWFLAAEERLGMEAAIELDTRAWERFAAAEAQRIMTTFQVPHQGGLEALEKALGLRMYSLINAQRVEWSRGPKALALFHGCLPGAGNPAAQRACRFPVQERGDGRIRDLCPNHRLAYPHHLPALSSGDDRWKILRLGVQRGEKTREVKQGKPALGVTWPRGRVPTARCRRPRLWPHQRRPRC